MDRQIKKWTDIRIDGRGRTDRRCDDTSKNVLPRPILSNSNILTSRDAVDDLFQRTLDALTNITMG